MAWSVKIAVLFAALASAGAFVERDEESAAVLSPGSHRAPALAAAPRFSAGGEAARAGARMDPIQLSVVFFLQTVSAVASGFTELVRGSAARAIARATARLACDARGPPAPPPLHPRRPAHSAPRSTSSAPPLSRTRPPKRWRT